MNREMAKKVADAVLYEGYMLYPYRPSALKNRQRWTFGILYPPAYGEVSRGTERCGMHSECLLEAEGDATVHVQLRFLHLVSRRVAKLRDGGRFEAVASLVVDDHRIESWDEVMERSVELELAAGDGGRQQVRFRFLGSRTTEELQDRNGRVVGSIHRRQEEVTGSVSAVAEKIGGGVWKLTINVTNEVAKDDVTENDSVGEDEDRNSALLRSLLSAHTILTMEGGTFFSLLDPPEEMREMVRTCKNVGNFPVLVGTEPERGMLFCSPIVLYDYPQIAPESASNFYDATEMDEMLTLRVLTLTDDEKDEMRLVDDHVGKLLQRTEENAREQLTRTHGTIRGMRSVSEKP